MLKKYTTQNELLLNNLMKFYNIDNNLQKILPIINGQSTLSIRIIDWFVTNFSKKHYTVYNIEENGITKRFKVYVDYKLKLKAYSKRRFDPFCRWERINIPYNNDSYIQTTIGQLNFFKWALDNKILDYIVENIDKIEEDMNNRNSTSRNNKSSNKTRKKREELSINAIKSIKKENIEIIVKFN
jgi:DNA-binding Lrp family transcriptional regulator